MIPGSKGLKPPVLAQRWCNGLGTRPNMSIKVERKLHDMRILDRIVGVRSTEQFVWHLLTPTSFYNHYIKSKKHCTLAKRPVLQCLIEFFQSFLFLHRNPSQYICNGAEKDNDNAGGCQIFQEEMI